MEVDYLPEIKPLLNILDVKHGGLGLGLLDPAGLRKAAHQLSELAKQDELVDEIVNGNAIQIVSPLLNLSALGVQQHR